LAAEMPLLLLFLAAQTVLVAVGFRNRWSTIQTWLPAIKATFLQAGQPRRAWLQTRWIGQLLGVGAVFALSSAAVSPEPGSYLAELLWATFVQLVNLGSVVLMVWAIPDDMLVQFRQRGAMLFHPSSAENVDQRGGIERLAVLAAVWVTIVSA